MDTHSKVSGAKEGDTEIHTCAHTHGSRRSLAHKGKTGTAVTRSHVAIGQKPDTLYLDVACSVDGLLWHKVFLIKILSLENTPNLHSSRQLGK